MSEPTTNVILVSMITTSRNISGYKFSTTINLQEQQELQQTIIKIAKALQLHVIQIPSLTLSQKNMLVSQGIISKSFTLEPSHYILNDPVTHAYYVICDENHLTYKLQQPGFLVRSLYEQCIHDLNTFSNHLQFAYDQEFGYLTTSIAELGTGMVFSFLIHVPGLSLYGALDSVFRQILETGCEISSKSLSSFGPNGAFFTITMPVIPFGYEANYLERIERALQSLIEYEQTIQAKLLSNNTLQLYDKIGRSFGLLQYAYEVSYDEYIAIMSDIRFGIQTGVLTCEHPTILDSYIICDPVLTVENQHEKLESEAQTRAVQMKKIAKYITFNTKEF
ncbi:MAG TPA: hypothetical protein P5519_00255 [Spirochaetia bacterium]|nr:hypothetical protein [Spirochaetales bacterium]HRS64302.1 hypothetical protein [Spirochaetia bacterium]HOT58330.1 hypothetical protein [Spirochaetales bacterium]HPD80065.1 hypothetical protein [Spirochaetales bacterium]HQK33441.1 hypothetical protein [Spirochaetales bacterium]